MKNSITFKEAQAGGTTGRHAEFYIPGSDNVVVSEDGIYSILNSEGERITSRNYTMIGPFKNGLAIVAINEKYGLIRAEGRIVLPVKYDSIRMDNLAYRLRKDNLWGFFAKGKLFKPQFRFIEAFNATETRVESFEGKWGVVNVDGQIIVNPCYFWIGQKIGVTYQVSNGYNKFAVKAKN